MARPALQSKNWDFTVRQEQITHNGVKLPYFGNFRSDNNACLGIATDQYGVVQNSELIDAARDALKERGLKGYDESIIVSGEGQKMFATFSFRNKQIASDVGDVFGYQLVLKNSFDRSTRAAFELMFERLVCKNGMATMEKEFGVTQKHSTKISVAFVASAIDNALNRGTEALQVYDQMARVKLTDAKGETILRNLEEKNILSGTVRENIRTLWLAPRRKEDEARTLYNLYNAVTEYLTHGVSGSRFEYAAKVNNNVLFSLVNAARNKANLEKLLVPVGSNN